MMRLWWRWGTVTSAFSNRTVTSLTWMSSRSESISQMSSWMRALPESETRHQQRV
jgi:hypothetical protein